MRRALRVTRLTREKKRRRRVLAVATGSPSPMRRVHGLRLWRMGDDLYSQPDGVGGETARGEMVELHAVLQGANSVLDLGVAATVGLQA